MVRYLSRGNVLQSSTAPYGSSVFYKGDIPTYTGEETAYKYYLFTGWDKSGFVSGDKDVNAVFDSCEYNEGYFDDKPLSKLRPVEMYALTKLGIEEDVVKLKDSFSFELGHDYSYDDISEKVIISEKKYLQAQNITTRIFLSSMKIEISHLQLIILLMELRLRLLLLPSVSK